MVVLDSFASWVIGILKTHILSLLQNPVPNVEDLKVGRFVAAKYQGAWSRAEVVDVKGVCIGRFSE